MNEENRLIIKQLNKYGRIPQTYELLKMIEDLEHNWNDLKKWVEDYLKEKNKERLYDNNSYEAGVIATYENILDKMQELEEGENNDNRT